MKKLFAIIYVISLFACSQQSQHKPVTQSHVGTQKVKCYKQRKTNDDGTSSFIYWYMIMSMNNHSCYYYTSDVEVLDYSTVHWTSSNESPMENLDAIEYEPLPDTQVQYQDFSVEMQQEMDLNAEYFGGLTQEEMGDYEGGGTDNGSENATETGSDAPDASSDGGGDSGGGDSGGGDGGGGE